MSKKKERTIYDLKAWELLGSKPELVLIITSPKGELVTVELATNISFQVYKADTGYIFNIVTFERWVAGFSKYHGVKCVTWDDVKTFYQKEGARHW